MKKKSLIIEIVIMALVVGYTLINAIVEFNLSKALSFSGILITGLSYAIIITGTHYLFNFFKDIIINKDKEKIRATKIFVFYFLYLLTAMLLINKILGFNGQNIHSDMLTIIDRLKEFNFCSYQGWYSSIFYFTGFILFPSFLKSVSVVLLQIILSSLLFTYVFQFFHQHSSKIFKIVWILANMILPAAFFNQFCLRQLWFAQIAIILAIQIYQLKDTNSNKQYLKIIFLTALLSVLRPEAIVYIPFILLFIFFINKELSLKKKAIYTLLLVLSFIALRIPQKDDNEYKSTAILNPLSYLVQYDDLNWGGAKAKEDGIAAIDKVFDYETLKANSSYTGLKLIYNDDAAWHRDFTDEEFQELTKTYIKLILYNPFRWLKGRYLTFKTSFSRKGIMSYQIFFKKYTKNRFINGILQFIYQPILFLTVNVVALIYYMFKKQKNKFVMSALALIEAGMMFILNTASTYMFIYPFWYISLFISIIFISDLFNARKAHN